MFHPPWYYLLHPSHTLDLFRPSPIALKPASDLLVFPSEALSIFSDSSFDETLLPSPSGYCDNLPVCHATSPSHLVEASYLLKTSVLATSLSHIEKEIFAS